MTDDTRLQASPTPVVEVPPPSSLCPVCGCVEVDARQHMNGATHLIFYACDNGHEWLTRWNEVA